MSATDKKNIPVYVQIEKNKVVKISQATGTWQINTVTMFGNIGPSPFNVIVNVRSEGAMDKLSIKISALTSIGTEGHFYQKGGGIYMLNASLNDPFQGFVLTKGGIEAVDVAIDDTFTEISIEKV